MRILSKGSNNTTELGLLVSLSVVKYPGQALSSKYRNEFYINDAGQLVWDIFQLSRSTTEPVASVAYDVVKE